MRLRPEYAPNAVNDFVFLAKKGFYDGLTFSQVCPADDRRDVSRTRDGRDRR